MNFGTYNGNPIIWRVLDVQGGKSLVITEELLEKKAFHDPGGSVRWGDCTLRDWLNGAFLAGFTPEEQKRIVETDIVTPDNPWYSPYNGQAETTRDRVFLLSLEEVCTYFGDGSILQRLRNKEARHKFEKGYYADPNGWYLHDENSGARVAKIGNKAWWWWLRSPGYFSSFAAYVLDYGGVYVDGHDVDSVGYGLRPAMWLVT